MPTTMATALRLEEAGVEPIVGDVAAMDLRPAPLGDHPCLPRSGATGPRGAGQGLATGLRDERPGVGPSGGGVSRARRSCTARQARRTNTRGTDRCARTTRPGVHLGAYSLSKIAGEAVVRYAAAASANPLTIIRIFSTYGPEGGTPVNRLRRILRGDDVVLHPDAPNNYNPIYEDDYVDLAVRALEVASPEPVVVNFAGSETVSAEDYCAYLGELVGRPALHPLRPRRPLADLARRHPHARRPRTHPGALARGHATGGRRVRLIRLQRHAAGPPLIP